MKFLIQILIASLLLIPVAAPAADANPLTAAPSTGKINGLPNPFGAFNLVMYGRPASNQVELLQSIGYDGIMACTWGKDALAHLRDFAAVPAVRDGKFSVYSVLWTPDLIQGYDEKWLNELIPLTAQLHASLWVAVFGDRAQHERLLSMLQSLADKCRAQNVPLVLYPHAGSTFEDAEEALALIKEMNRPEVKLSVHISHEFMAGNEPRMEEVIAKVAPYIALASINGVDSAADYRKVNYDVTIMPLGQGSYDVRPYVASLVRHGYRGPFLQHTWGFKSPPEQHLAACIQAWRKISADVATQIAAEKPSASRHAGEGAPIVPAR